MQMWSSIKRQLANSRAVKLVEKRIKSKTPQIQGQDNVYAADSGKTLFKVELFAGQDDTVSEMDIARWVIFALILMLLTIPVIRAIIRVMKTCQQQTDSYNLDFSPVKDMEDNYKITYTPTSLPEIVESSSPSMEKAWEELSQGHNPDSSGRPDLYKSR